MGNPRSLAARQTTVDKKAKGDPSLDPWPRFAAPDGSVGQAENSD